MCDITYAEDLDLNTAWIQHYTVLKFDQKNLNKMKLHKTSPQTKLC